MAVKKVTVVLVVLLVAVMGVRAPAQASSVKRWPCEVVSVKDGDGIVVDCPGHYRGEVRLAAVNTPESAAIRNRNGKVYGPECYGQEALAYVRSRVHGATSGTSFSSSSGSWGGSTTSTWRTVVSPGTKVVVETDGDRDNNKRLLGYVFIGDENLNLTLVKLGYAQTTLGKWDTWEPWATQLAQAERAAWKANIGLWRCTPQVAHNSKPLVP